MGFVDAIVQSVIETNCIHAFMLFALGLLVLLLFSEELLVIQVGLNLENLFGKRSEDETAVTFAGVLRLPPVVEVLANLRDHRADFKGNERHEGGEVTNLVVLPTIILNQRDTPHGLATGGTMHVDDAFGAADFLQAKQEHRRTREDLRLRVIHVVTVLGGADFGFAEHDANRVSVGAHRDVPDERRRTVAVLARFVHMPTTIREVVAVDVLA